MTSGYRKKLIWTLPFYERYRDLYEVSDASDFRWDKDGLRLAFTRPACQYAPDMPVVTCPLWLPNGLVSLDGFELVAEIPEEAGIELQLWNGQAWMVYDTDLGQWLDADEESPVPWSDEAALQQGFRGGFEWIERAIGARARLLSDEDGLVTPLLKEIRFLATIDYDLEQDLVYNTLIPYLEHVRAVSEAEYDLEEEADTIVLTGRKNDIEYDGLQITGIHSAFNLTRDPSRKVDIKDGWNPTTRTLTFIGASPIFDEGDVAQLNFIHQPRFVVITSLDYHETDKIPEAVIEDLRVGAERQLTAPGIIRYDKALFKAYKINAPKELDYVFNLGVLAPTLPMATRILSAVREHIAENGVLVSYATGAHYEIAVSDELNSVRVFSRPNTDERAVQLEVTISGVPLFEAGAEDTFFPGQVNVNTFNCCRSSS